MGGIPPDPSTVIAATRAMGQAPASSLAASDDPPNDLAASAATIVVVVAMAFAGAAVAPTVAFTAVAIPVEGSNRVPLPWTSHTAGTQPCLHPLPPSSFAPPPLSSSSSLPPSSSSPLRWHEA